MPRERLSLRLEIENGTKADGTTKIRSKSFSNINQQSTDDQLLQGGKAMASLMTKPVLAYKKIEVTKLESPQA